MNVKKVVEIGRIAERSVATAMGHEHMDEKPYICLGRFKMKRKKNTIKYVSWWILLLGTLLLFMAAVSSTVAADSNASSPEETTSPISQSTDLDQAFTQALALYRQQNKPAQMLVITQKHDTINYAYAIAEANMPPVGKPVGGLFVPLLAQRNDQGVWEAIAPTLVNDSQFNLWLDATPASLMDEATKAMLARPIVTRLVTEQTQQGAVEVTADSVTGHKLPWTSGRSSQLTGKDNCWISGCSGTGHESQLDFGIEGSSVNGDVYASKPGTVVFVKESSSNGSCNFDNWKQANMVVVQHGPSEYSWYVHLAFNSASVTVGQNVDYGAKVGVEGDTGYACGVHLHYMASTGYTTWTDPADPNDAPWATGITTVDFSEVTWNSLTVGNWYTSQNTGSGTSCPQSGGLILYWNADYDCSNNEGDSGYRQVASTGLHNVNDGAFNDKSSSLKVQSGWSVRLHEHENGGGGNVCYNSDISDFSAQGTFPGTSTSINDQVSSITVYDNADCGENPPPQPNPGEWYVEFFNDTTLTNRCSPANQITPGPYAFRDWGDASPYSGCNSDNWSARFWRTVYFESGTYNFGLGSDDWTRLIVDGDLVLNNWQGAGQHYASRTYSAGYRNVTVEFADTLGAAKLAAWWWGPGYQMPRESRDPYQWYAQYWGNKDLWWDSIIRVNEGTGNLYHSWGSSGPGYGLPEDKFSSRFERRAFFSCGTHRFSISSDDGVRFWIDGIQRLNEWRDQVASFTVDVTLSEGYHELKLEHYENGGGAGLILQTSQLSSCSPNAPYNLVATAVSQSQIDLSWADNSSNEDGFLVERSPDGVAGWVQIATQGGNVATYSDTGLSSGTTYYYRVQSYNAVGASSYSNTDSDTTFSAPAGPSDLSAAAISQSQIDLSWKDNADNEDGFKVERSFDGITGWTQIAILSAATTGYSDTGLTSGIVHYYRVLAFNASGDSGYSNTANATTLSVPVAPISLEAAAVSQSQIDLTWVDISANEAGFEVERSLNGSTDWTLIATLGMNATSYMDTGLSPGTTYHYRVRAFNVIGNSYYSNVASDATFSLPAAPSNLVATTFSDSEVGLTWQDNAVNETSFEIERTVDDVNWSLVGSTSSDVTSFSDTSLSPGTTYTYRVRAGNLVGYSDYSNQVSATTDAPPATPTNLTAIPISGTQIDLDWSDNADNEKGYRIERSLDDVTWLVFSILGPNTSAYSDKGLVEGTTYHYRVVVFNESGESHSASAVATTLSRPGASTGLIGEAVSPSQVDLSWDGNASNVDGFRLERSEDGISWQLVATLDPDVVTYSDTSLAPETTYRYRLQAFNQVGDSSYSNEAIVTTPAEPAEPIVVDDLAIADIFGDGAVSGSYQDTWAADSQVQGITERHSGGKPAKRYSYLEHAWEFNVNGGDTVTLLTTAWLGASGDGETFTFAYSFDGTNYEEMFTVSDTVAGEYAFTLPAGTRGNVIVRVTDNDQTSGNGSLDTILVDRLVVRSESGSGNPPAAPTELSATVALANQIDVQWTDNATDEYGFEVLRSLDGQNWTVVETLNADITFFSDFGIEPSTTYHYQVRAFNGAGNSGPSNMASVTTPDTLEPGLIHVGDLDALGVPGKPNRWDATVTITVHDENHNPVVGVTVSGAWGGALSGTSACVTDNNGQCQVTRTNIKNSAGNATFAVTALELAGYTYASASNHDMDGDSNGTVIEIAIP